MFDRCAILIADGSDADVGLAAARAIVSPGGHVALIGWHRPRFWHIGDMWSAVDARVADAEGALEARAAALRAEGYRARATLHLADDAPTAAVPADAELVVIPADPLSEAARQWTERLLDAGRTVAWARGDAPPLGPETHAVVAYVGPARRALPAVAALRQRATGGERLTLLHVPLGDALGDAPTAAPTELRDLIGWPGPVALDGLPGGLGTAGDLDRWLTTHQAHLLAVPAPAGLGRGLLLRALAMLVRPLPILLVPDPGLAADTPPLDGPDLVRRPGQPLVARLDTVDGFGGARRLTGHTLEVIVAGDPIGACAVVDGLARLPPLPAETALVGFAPSGASLGQLAAAVRIIDPPPGSRVALFDAEAPVDPTTFAAIGTPGDPTGAGRIWLASRMDPTLPCRTLRARLAPYPIAGLIDAGSVLEDGDPDDLPAAARPLRLARVARHLRAVGFAVDLVLGPAPIGGAAHCPVPRWNALAPAQRRARIQRSHRAPPAADDPSGILRALTDATPLAASRIQIELHNDAARHRLLALIDGAAGRIDLQTYIFEPDPVGHAVAAALMRALDRGVGVRLLVDALFSQHGAMGQQNPALIPLDQRGCLRVIRPFTVPGLDDLKRRDHRKLMVIDRRIGWITGRNIGAPYYTGFAESGLTAESPYRDVPWLDAGAELEGPAVHAIAAAFERHWRAAGGEPVRPTRAPDPPTGGIPVWLVQHESMRDTRTLDAYRHLIGRAERRITIVNTFPLQFELQQALRDALGRGVAVRFLVGHVRPLFGPERRPFRGGAIRSLATEVIHGRLDGLMAAGAEARGFALRAVPGWDPALGTVLPHVHAKLVSVDGRRYAIGSANLDITAGYWESEALLLVEHAGETARLDARLDALLAEAIPIDTDPQWSATAARRTWVSRHWPSLLG